MIPYDKRDISLVQQRISWLEQCQDHVLNHGLLCELCFRGLRVYDGEIFKLDEHTSRFSTLQKEWSEIPFSENEINKASKQIVKTQEVKNGYVRPVAWRGSGMAISAQQTKIHVAIATWEWGHTLIQI